MGHKLLYLVLNIFLLYSSTLQESCDKPLGLGDGSIPDKSITASSVQKSWYDAKQVRLTDKNRVWRPKNQAVGEYIQIDLNNLFYVTGVATQGMNGSLSYLYVDSYYIAYGRDGKTFSNYTDDQGVTLVFRDNAKPYQVSFNKLIPGVSARFIRLYPLSWKRQLNLKMELYGCAVKLCSVNKGGCSETCSQVSEYEIQCGCHNSGYKYVNGECKDIDECLQEMRPCAQNCQNTDGSFVCSCKSGYILGKDNVSCYDIDECKGNHSCHHNCVNTPGSYHCECQHGYEFGADGKTCIDIDECTRKTARCEHVCHNTNGSFFCSCRSGYELGHNRKSCKDINECVRNTHKCAQICDNNNGGYTCRCRNGYVLSADGRQCDDVNECDVNKGGCSHECVNNRGSFSCSCPKGYQLNLNGKTCEDVNECKYNKGNCADICNNNDGSYTCSCYSGYQLKSDGHSCEDIDECMGTNDCDLLSTNCINAEASYRCSCKRGYQPKEGSWTSCERVKCSVLPVSSRYTVSPPSCQTSDANYFEAECKYSCTKGYQTTNPSAMVVKCLANRQWSSGEPQCLGVKCPGIADIPNGKIYPATCAQGIRYPEKCIIRCNPGYLHTGVSQVGCQSDGKLNVTNFSNLGCEKDKIKPIITCPPGITEVLPLGKRSMDVSMYWRNARTTLGTIKSSHDRNYKFPAGITEVTFTATTVDGLQDSCSIRVTISDQEPPRVVRCPGNQIVKIDTKNTWVNWTEPQFIDNVGVVSVTSDPDFGRLSEGDHEILYIAKDAAGNRATCKFTVNVREKKCDENELPVGIGVIKNCQTFPGADAINCVPNCPAGKTFFGEANYYYYCSSIYGNSWEPNAKLPVPDCVGQTAFTGQCPEGTIEKTIPYTSNKICVNCRPGTYYENKKCIPCPVGYYAANEKESSCKKCESGYSTQKIGAHTCERLCEPGTFSKTGFPGQNYCQYCPVATYQPEYGQKSCLQCPVDTITLGIGRKASSDCGREGEISLKPSSKVSIVENNDVTFSCYSSALPTVTVHWKKMKPLPDGIGGHVTQTDIIGNDGRLIGKTYKILKAVYDDRGVYVCQTENSFGTIQGLLHLDVKKDLPNTVG